MKNKTLILAAFGLLFSPNFSFGQINLGTASSFALFTSVGAIDNIGPSNFIGDIGTNAGTISGFPPGTLSGQIFQENPTTLQVAADVEDAYNYLTGVPCDSTLGNALGDNQILTANVYCILTAASLNGDLILDGENNPGALFIIKIGGVLDVIGLSKVLLINSASVSNVYWQIDGAVNVYDSAVFRGTILANGALTFYNAAAMHGNALTRQGAISTLNSTVTISSQSAMPVELIKFEGKNKHTHNLISWSTASEINNSHFTLERTTDGFNYTEVIRINGVGTSSSINNYTYSDFDFEKKQNYYRLSQTDYDGESETFEAISIDNSRAPVHILKVVNMMGQEVDEASTGLRVIYFDNGEVIKISGKYLDNQ